MACPEAPFTRLSITAAALAGVMVLSAGAISCWQTHAVQALWPYRQHE